MKKYNLKFQIAISFTNDSRIIAEDLYNLFTEQGLTVYNHLKQPDVVKGIVDENTEQIYKTSDVNIMIWNKTYSGRGEDDIVLVEKNILHERHIKNNQRESLFIIINDINILPGDKPILSNRFNNIIYYSLNKKGLIEIRNSVINRLIDCYDYVNSNSNIVMMHPIYEKLNRGSMSFCKFRISEKYNFENRFHYLSDVLVEIIQNENRFIGNSLQVFLIPSGRVTSLLSHSTILKTQKRNLEIKKNLTLEFLKNNMEKEFFGYLFFARSRDMDYPMVYCFEYDDFLNNQLANIK